MELISSLKCVLTIFLLICTTKNAEGVNTWAATKDNYVALYNFYYNNGISLTDILPVQTQDDGIEINMSVALDSVNGFDAVKGQIEISGSVYLEWTDETLTIASIDPTNPSDDILTIDPGKIWTPSIVLLNAVDTVSNIGDTTYKLRFNVTDGTVTWQPRVLLKASCSPDVKYYPFDRQSCSFTYSAWGYATSEINLNVLSNEWDLRNYEDNGVWDIVSTSSSTYQSSGSTYATFSIIIDRHPLYFAFNIALPILLLGLLNGFVFLLPAESGERVGFCITCFLSFVVLLQTTMAFLPEIASPMSLLCFYIIVMMIFSMGINILTILMLRVYHKPPKEKVVYTYGT